MTNEEMLREFTALPPEGKRVVTDLIAFLRQRYTNSTAIPIVPVNDFSKDNSIGMWRDREDMQDSTQWVRTARQDEWGG